MSALFFIENPFTKMKITAEQPVKLEDIQVKPVR